MGASEDRRKHGRLAQAFEGSWRGASGQTRCRIGDFSLGGCFIQSLAMPQTGEKTVVTVIQGDEAHSFTGSVVYTEPGMGFAVQFADLSPEQVAQINGLIATAASRSNAV